MRIWSSPITHPRFAKKIAWFKSRRGVAAVLAMMFMVLFGSLSVAMAIVSKGNITTAATHLHVTRAQGAAETGLAIARSRLNAAVARFVVASSNVDEFGVRLWEGRWDAGDTYRVLPPKTGRLDVQTPSSLYQAIADLHAQDQDVVVVPGGTSTVSTGNNPLETTNARYGEYLSGGTWVFAPAVAIEPRIVGDANLPLSYRVTYAPLANGTDIRVMVTGYDFAYGRGGQPITRTVSQDFRIAKRVNHAIVSPNRVMIGKNVHIAGDLGLRYNDVSQTNGDPLVMKSDFLGLDSVLDQKLALFFDGVRQYDVDGDNRLRVRHPVETQGIPSSSGFYNPDGTPQDAFADVTTDGYLDDFDIFIRHFDRNADNKLKLSTALTDGTPAASSGGSAEFTVDDDLAVLIDSVGPDRNRNGVWGWVDDNNNGRWDSGEAMNDRDSNNRNRDQILGWRDGFIDKKDQYAKVNGRVSFRVTQAAWTAAQGDISPKVKGSIKPDPGKSPRRYGVGDDELPAIDPSTMSSDGLALIAEANGGTFAAQVAANLGIGESLLPTYVETRAAGAGVIRYLRVDPDANGDGLPDNHATAYFERMPFGSPAPTDIYFRPVYENMVFKNVVIPMGTNALFKNCTFVGVTHIRSHTDNTHVIWSEYGKLQIDSGTGRPRLVSPRTAYTGSETDVYAGLPRPTAVPPQQTLLMGNPPLDKADLLVSQAAITQGFNLLPEPLVIGGRRVTDTKAYSNNIRFHGCLIIGSLVSDPVTGYTQARNKLQFTGSTKFLDKHPTYPDDANLNPDASSLDEISRSSLMVPNYSVDLGAFNSPTDQDLRLKGAIIAGVMDIRGNATIDGALLLTFDPIRGQGPLRDSQGNPIGNPAGFNSTIGYFGSNDGDSEALDPNTLPIVNGQRIAGWDTDGDGIFDVPATSAQPPGSTAVPFNGYGRIDIRFDPDMGIPNGLMLPLQVVDLPTTYREGKP